jgi:hypothetical protein
MKRGLILLIVSFLFLYSCSPPGGTMGTRNNPDGDIHRGYKGITMRFVEGYPPNQIYAPKYQSDQFNIIMEVQNEGTGTPNNHLFVLSGYDPNIIKFGSSSAHYYRKAYSNKYTGKSLDNPVGHIDTEMWEKVYVTLPDGTDRFRQSFLVTQCYDYQTTATIGVCVDPKPWKAGKSNQICNPGAVTLSGGQGAPVSITNVDVSPMTNKVQLKVEVQNVGDGDVVDKLEVCRTVGGCRCPHDLEITDLNEVDIDTVVLGTGKMCTDLNPNPVLLVNGRGYFYCTVDVTPTDGREDAYVSQLKVVLTYGYRSSIRKDMEIIAVP